MNSSLRESKKWRKSNPSEWSTLGTDILEEIIKRSKSNTRTDILRFRAVCKGWRSSIPLPPIPNNLFCRIRLPLKLPYPNLENSQGKAHLILKENTIYSLEPLVEIYIHSPKKEPTKNWFVKIEEPQSGKVILMDPLSRKTVKDMGKITSLPKVINLLDYRVKEVAKEYSLQLVKGKNSPPRDSYYVVKKVVVGHQKGDDEFVVMIVGIDGKLGVWKKGEDRWIEIDNGFCYQDIAYYKGRFYAVDYKMRIIAVDCSSFEITRLVAPSISSFVELYADHITHLGYLVKSLGDFDLYLVIKWESFIVYVFRFDEEFGKWVDYRKLLVDRVLFVGEWGCCSYSVSTREFSGCKDKCIYYINDTFRSCVRDMDDYPGRDVLLCHISEPSTRSLNSVSVYSQLFWPPPTWLKQTPC